MLDSVITRLPSSSVVGYSSLRQHFARVLIVFSLFNPILIMLTALISNTVSSVSVLLIGGYLAASLITLYLSLRGWTRSVMVLLLVIHLSAILLIPEALLFNAIMAVVAAAMLTNSTTYWGVSLAVCAVFIAKTLMQTNEATEAAFDFNYLVMMFTVIMVSITSRFLANRFEAVAERSQASANLLQAAAATGEIIGKVLKIDELLPQAVDLIRERFAFYHVQIFLLDETGENAQLAASTGEIGRMLFARQHSLPVGSRSVIGRVTSSGTPVIANDTDSFHHRNELLPNTRSELALPILDGDKIIGALDVQSRRYEVFTTEVVQALQVLANQLGITIRNARLFEEQEKTTLEARRLFLESETNLREIQRLNQQLTRAGWQDYLQTRKTVSGVTLHQNVMTPEAQWTDSLLEASSERQAVTTEREGQRVIAVPMMLGSEVIGAIEIEAGNEVQEADITEMVNAVAQRLALSLDKARLFEESQEATAREQRINEIVTRYQSVNNVDELLRITLKELSQSLGATHSSIRLGTAPAANPNGEVHA